MTEKEYLDLKPGNRIKHKINGTTYQILREAINPKNKNSKIYIAGKFKFIASPKIWKKIKS